MKRRALLSVSILLAIFLLPPRTAHAAATSPGVDVQVENGYSCDYGVDIPFTRSQKTERYTFAIYPGGDTAAAPEMTAEVTITPTARVNVHLPLEFDPALPSTHTLKVTAHPAPGREGLDREASATKTFVTTPTCGCPAGTTGVFYAGVGGAQSPFRVATPEQLAHVNRHLSSQFRQTEHIDLSGWPSSWTPISTFTGVYDGDGYTISHIPLNMAQAGLFGTVSGGRILRLGVTDTSASSTGSPTASILTLGLVENAALEECFVRDCSLSAVDTSYIGMLTTSAQANTSITNCYTAHVSVQGRHVGGLVSSSNGALTFTNCFSIVDRIAWYSHGRGLLLGWDYTGAVFSNCYYSNDTAPGASSGAVGWYDRSSTYNYDPVGTTGLALSSFSSLENLPGFSDEFWEVKEGAEYPTLKCERPLNS